MSDTDKLAEMNAESFAALWTAYCDKKMEVEGLQDRIAKLEAALRELVTAACLSMRTLVDEADGWAGIYEPILKQARKALGDE